MNSKNYDRHDKATLRQLAAERKCQERVIVDKGYHYVFCGKPARLVGKKYKCSLHK